VIIRGPEWHVIGCQWRTTDKVKRESLNTNIGCFLASDRLTFRGFTNGSKLTNERAGPRARVWRGSSWKPSKSVEKLVYEVFKDSSKSLGDKKLWGYDRFRQRPTNLRIQANDINRIEVRRVAGEPFYINRHVNFEPRKLFDRKLWNRHIPRFNSVFEKQRSGPLALK